VRGPPSSMNVRLTPPTAKGYSHCERLPFCLWRSKSKTVGCRCARNSRHSSASSPAPLKSVPGSVPCAIRTSGSCQRSLVCCGLEACTPQPLGCSPCSAAGKHVHCATCMRWPARPPAPQPSAGCRHAQAICWQLHRSAGHPAHLPAHVLPALGLQAVARLPWVRRLPQLPQHLLQKVRRTAAGHPHKLAKCTLLSHFLASC
jgi:hypothetical protein